MCHESKRIIVINLHRLTNESGNGDAICLSQCNRSIGVKCATKKNRKEMSKEIRNYLHTINEGKKVIIVSDFNHEIGGDEMQQFYREIVIQDLLSGHERVPWNCTCVAFKRRSRCIDHIAVSKVLVPFAEKFEVIDWDEKFSTCHRGHVIELNLDQFL